MTAAAPLLNAPLGALLVACIALLNRRVTDLETALAAAKTLNERLKAGQP